MAFISVVISLISTAISFFSLHHTLNKTVFIHNKFEHTNYEAIFVFNDVQQNRSYSDIILDLKTEGMSKYSIHGCDGFYPLIIDGEKYIGLFLCEDAGNIIVSTVKSKIIKYVYITQTGMDKHPSLKKKEYPC